MFEIDHSYSFLTRVYIDNDCFFTFYAGMYDPLLGQYISKNIMIGFFTFTRIYMYGIMNMLYKLAYKLNHKRLRFVP